MGKWIKPFAPLMCQNKWMDERELLERCIRRDEEAIETLIRRYERMVYGFSYRLTGSQEDAKDITQKVFVKVIENLKKFKGASSFSTWLYRITVNECLNHKRKKTREDTEIEGTIHASQESSLSGLLRDERARILKEALEQLPHRQRLAIVLRIYEDMTVSEVAEIMGISEGAVKANYHFGIKRLREILRRMGYESIA